MHSIKLQIYAGLTQQRADKVQRLEERAEEAEHRRESEHFGPLMGSVN